MTDWLLWMGNHGNEDECQLFSVGWFTNRNAAVQWSMVLLPSSFRSE